MTLGDLRNAYPIVISNLNKRLKIFFAIKQLSINDKFSLCV